MRYAGIIENDVVNGEGICLSYWTQGCPHKCDGCHNPETWNFNCGKEDSKENILNKILTLLNKNSIHRNLSILGGEPLCDENIDFTMEILKQVKQKYPSIKTFVWTGYTYEELCKLYKDIIFDNIDVLIDGKYDKNQRDITLKLRGSKNQRVLRKNIDF